MSAAQIRHSVESGEWKVLIRSVYASTSVPATWEQLVLAWCLRRDGAAWASHRTAARLLGLAGGSEDPIDITVPRDLRSSDVIVHHATQLPPCDRTHVGLIPVTNAERALLDLAGVVDDEVLDDAGDDALMARLTTPPKIEWRLRRIGGRGHSGAAILRGIVVDRMSERTPIGSRLERRFLRAIARAGYPTPQLQYEIRLGQARRALADFAYPAQRLVVEVLGYRWHGGRQRWERDLVRSSDLAALGWRVIYVTRQQLRDHEGETMERLGRTLGVVRLPLHLDVDAV